MAALILVVGKTQSVIESRRENTLCGRLSTGGLLFDLNFKKATCLF